MITTPPAADLRRRIMAGLIAGVTVATLVVALAVVLTRTPAAEGERAPSADAADPAGPSWRARTPTGRPATATCALEPDRPGLPEVRLTYPGDWYVAGEDWTCGFFDPDPDAVVEPGTEIHGIDVWWKYEHVPFALMVSPSETLDETSRTETTVSGRRAVRIAGTATGVGMYEAGVPITLWVIDLGGDGDSGVTLLGAVVGVDCVDCDRAVQVLDQMAAQVVIARS